MPHIPAFKVIGVDEWVWRRAIAIEPRKQPNEISSEIPKGVDYNDGDQTANI
jgi:hypothetical protein